MRRQSVLKTDRNFDPRLMLIIIGNRVRGGNGNVRGPCREGFRGPGTLRGTGLSKRSANFERSGTVRHKGGLSFFGAGSFYATSSAGTYSHSSGGGGLFVSFGGARSGGLYSPICSRIFRIVFSSSMNAITPILPPHFGQTSGSTS